MKNTTVTLRFTELLSALIKGKTSIVDALNILSQGGMEKYIRDSAKSLLTTMKKGKCLSESLRISEKGKIFFDPLYLTLITAAELTGNLENVLDRIAADLRRKRRAKENAANILIYPAIIVTLAIAGTIMIIVKVIPLFISGGLVSDDVVSNAIAGICIAAFVLLSGGSGLFIYYFRIFYHDSPEFKIFYILDLLLRSNVTLTEALSQCVVSMAATKYGAILLQIKKDIASGISFSEAFAKIKNFSPYIIGWLSVANAHGNISEACQSIRDHYEQKDNKVRELAVKLIEPAVIMLTGVYVLIIMVTVILPILTFAGGIL